MLRVEHREDEWKFPFVEYSPENSNTPEGKKLPLIIQLHGAGERGNGEDELCRVDVHGFSKIIADEDVECIFVMPQCPLDSFWAARVESILAFIEQLKQEFNVDEDRVYLTGLSMGGFGTWFTAMANPNLFAAIAPVCGGGMGWCARTLKMPVWVFHGSEDKTVDPFYSDDMVTALRKADADVTYSKIDGVGHNVWNNAYNKELLDWLLSKKRS